MKLTKKQLKKIEKRELNMKDKEWRLSVLERDGKKCVICGNTNKVNVHHIIPREVRALRHCEYNGISLCSSHHKWSLECSAHRNPYIFMLWMTEHRKNQLNLLNAQYLKMIRNSKI